MTLSEFEVERFVNRGLRNECLIDGLLSNGRVGRANGWLSDEQVADFSKINPGIFTKIIEVHVVRRWPTRADIIESEPPGLFRESA